MRRLGAEQEPKAAKRRDPVAHLRVPADREVGSRDIERAAGMAGEQLVQHIGKPMLLVVDDVGDAHRSKLRVLQPVQCRS